MKVAKRIVKTVFFVNLLFSSAVFIVMIVLNISLSKSYKVGKGETFTLKSIIPIDVSLQNGEAVDTAIDTPGENYDVALKIFGFIPYKTVNVEVVDKSYVSVLGQPFGMRVYTDGVLVVDISEIRTEKGRVNVAEKSDIKIGDYIVSVDGKKIASNEDIADIVKNSGGKKLQFVLKRNKKKITKTVEPIISKMDGEYHVGIWVKDSSAGIGTLTFYSPTCGMVSGLGHGLTDSDTGNLLTVYSGQMVSAQIVNVKKGEKGKPGELGGSFTGEVIADISKNTVNGVYGKIQGEIPAANLTQIAMRQEIEDGDAQILCTVSGDTPRLYSCKVRRRDTTIFGGEENLVVTVTDEKLLEATGGIVQGMSGSPILQNGKLIGAVTHVLVDDPTTGYAVYAETLLSAAVEISENKLKAAG